MSCNDIASILDTHRSAHLAPAERTGVDAHLAACTDCAAAWHAQTELLALRVPPVPATLLERALLASRLPQSAQARRARMPVVVGSVLLAGAALATVTVVSIGDFGRRNEAPAGAVPTTGEPAEAVTQREPLDPAEAVRAESQEEHPTSVELVETGFDMAPLIRHAPTYPPEALAQRAEGHVQLKFDVTAAGAVENVTIVESSDARFEAAAVEALATWRYLPRLAAGKRVRTEGIRTMIRFAPTPDPAPSDSVREREVSAPQRELATFSAGLETALDRLASDDLRGVELQLDEMQALYGVEHEILWNFYGYLYTVQGRYDRAIDAYETSVAVSERSNFARSELNFSRSGPLVHLANLYFARHQYDMALQTLVRPNLPGGGHLMTPAANALMEKLNALGVTEDTL